MFANSVIKVVGCQIDDFQRVAKFTLPRFIIILFIVGELSSDDHYKS
jgi:hypothetical protein